MLGRGPRRWTGDKHKHNHFLKGKARGQGASSPRPGPGGRRCSPALRGCAPWRLAPAPLAGHVPLCGDRFSGEGLPRGDRGTEIQTIRQPAPRCGAERPGGPFPPGPAWGSKLSLQGPSLRPAATGGSSMQRRLSRDSALRTGAAAARHHGLQGSGQLLPRICGADGRTAESTRRRGQAQRAGGDSGRGFPEPETVFTSAPSPARGQAGRSTSGGPLLALRWGCSGWLLSTPLGRERWAILLSG